MFSADLQTFLLDSFMGSWQFLSPWAPLLQFHDSEQTGLHCNWWKHLLPQHPGMWLVLPRSLCPSKELWIRTDFLSGCLRRVHREPLWSLILTPLGLWVELKCHLCPATTGCFRLLWLEASTCPQSLLLAANSVWVLSAAVEAPWLRRNFRRSPI